MALLYRSPIEETMAKFTAEDCSRISNVAVNKFVEVEKTNFNFFNLAMSNLAKEKLVKSGVYLSPHSFMPHSHPVCKTLENYFLYQVLPSYVNESFYFVGIKNGKFNL
jgi:hypothetical protein